MTDRDFDQHSLDPMLFMHLDNNGILDCLVVFHVDDALITCFNEYNIKDHKDMFVWGRWKQLNKPGLPSLTFTDREVRQDDSGVIGVKQTKFIESTT